MFLGSNRKSEISELAEAIIDTYCKDTPINLELIASENNITFSYGDYGTSFDGMLEYENNAFHIYCNIDKGRSKDNARCRFTFAHELGHYFIDEHRNKLKYSNEKPHLSVTGYYSNDLIEKEADWFATNLLMTQSRLEKALKKTKAQISLNNIQVIAKNFNISLTSTAIRIVELNKTNCAIIKWDSQKKLQWFVISESWFRDHIGTVVQSFNKLSKETATYQVMIDDELNCSKRGSVLSYWFSNVSDRNYIRDQIINEEAIKLGQYGFLTFLYPAETLIY